MVWLTLFRTTCHDTQTWPQGNRVVNIALQNTDLPTLR